jgi:gluconolactonase
MMKRTLASVWGMIVVLLAGCASTQSGGGLSGVIAPDANVQLVQEGFVFTEGPVGAPDGGLYFTDLQKAQRIYRMAANGAITVLREKSNNVNGLAYTPRGELIGVESQGQRVVRISTTDGAFTEITRGSGATPMMLPNDLIADAKGGIYFTDPGPRPIPAGRKHHVYYLPPGATNAIMVDDNQTRPNGLTLTLDGKTFIVADTVEHVLHAWDVQPDGTLRNRRPFLRLQGIPTGEDSGGDGMAIDREGRFYVTSATGVQVFAASGAYLGTIATPKRPANVAFSGPGKRVLYITAREGLYRIQTLTAGPGRLGK